MKITILVTTHNRSKNLNNALCSIVNQVNLPCECEVLIVDDASNDNTKDIVTYYKLKYSQFSFNYIYVDRYPKEFTTPAASHNIGLIYASGDLIIQSGADIIMEHDTVRKLYDAYIAEPAYYAAKVCRLSERDVNSIPRTDVNSFFEYVYANRYEYNCTYNPSNYANATPFCCIYAKQCAYDIGLYDEEYAFGGGEDDDFVYRMQNVAFTRWLNTTKVTHQNHPKFNGRRRLKSEYEANLRRLKQTKKGIENRNRKRIMFMASFNYLPTKGFLP